MLECRDLGPESIACNGQFFGSVRFVSRCLTLERRDLRFGGVYTFQRGISLVLHVRKSLTPIIGGE